MSVVRVSIGPVSSTSARVWVASARETLAVVRVRPDLGVPDDVLDAFETYVDLWSIIAGTTDPFVWAGDIDADMLRHLAAHWARLVTLARAEPGTTGLRPAPPEGEAFYNALATALLDAAAVDDADHVSGRLEDTIPAFDAALARPASSGGRRVLIVDDNEDIRLLMRLAVDRDPRLVASGEAKSGLDAVEWVKDRCPDAILLDLLMPEMDGFTALPLLKAACPDATIVVFSAVPSPETRTKVIGLGATAFLQKTADTSAVLDALAGA